VLCKNSSEGGDSEGGGDMYDVEGDTLDLRKARMGLVSLGYSEDELDAFVYSSTMWAATSPRALHTADSLVWGGYD